MTDAAIYNEGIADRIATFETEPRSATDIAGWFTGEHLVVVAETGETGPVAFAASFPYSSRPCYRGIGEFSVYVRRDYRDRRAGRAVLAALVEAAAKRGMHKLTSRVFPENAASRALLKGLGFEEIGIHRRHGIGVLPISAGLSLSAFFALLILRARPAAAPAPA